MAAAETAFGGVVALRKHFRCVPEIIQSPDRVTAAADELPDTASGDHDTAKAQKPGKRRRDPEKEPF
jgi:hypothetical protein